MKGGGGKGICCLLWPCLVWPCWERDRTGEREGCQEHRLLPPPPLCSVLLRNRPDIPKAQAGNQEIDQEASLSAAWPVLPKQPPVMRQRTQAPGARTLHPPRTSPALFPPGLPAPSSQPMGSDPFPELQTCRRNCYPPPASRSNS